MRKNRVWHFALKEGGGIMSKLKLIKEAIELLEKRRRIANVNRIKEMDVPELCRLRDCLRLQESMGLQLEMPSSVVQLMISNSGGIAGAIEKELCGVGR